MANKKHQDPSISPRRALAPYNFVSLPDSVVLAPEIPSHDTCEHNSGYFTCTLKTFSPIYIRGLQRINLYRKLAIKKPKDYTLQDKLDRAPFYKVGSRLQVPGSSLRGLFRTLVEIIAWSKPLAVSADSMAYRSVDTTSHGIKYRDRIMNEVKTNVFHPRFMTGYMRRHGGNWKIQPAVEVGGVTYARIPLDVLNNVWDNLPGVSGKKNWDHVRRIFVKVDDPEYHTIHGFLNIRYAKVSKAAAHMEDGLREALVSKSGPMKSKESEAIIFPPNEDIPPEDWLPVSDDLVFSYRENLSQQLARLLGGRGVLQDGYPVFYLVEDGQVAGFSHCQMLRLPYKKRPYDLIPDHISQTPGPDLAEAIFGYTGKAYPQGEARAGRVFFGDADCLTNNVEEALLAPSVTRPHILSSPKPTSFQLYLTQDNPDDKEKLQDYDSDATIRGTKFYWHKDDRTAAQLETDDPKADEHENQYTRIRPVKAGVSFQFKLHFHNLTDLELGLLGWALEIAQNNTVRLNLGMGKPLGMGAVQVTESELHLIDPESRYSALFSEKEDGAVIWKTGDEVSPQEHNRKLRGCMAAYQRWLLAQPEINPNQCERLSDLPRYKELMCVLQWPGPKSARTRYQKLGEFRERTVLPTPEGVLVDLPYAAPTTHKPPTRTPPLPEPPDTPSAAAQDIANFLARSENNVPQPRVGDIVTATVFQKEKGYDFLSIKEQPEDILGQVFSADGNETPYAEGQELRCRVTNKGKKDGSDTIFKLEPLT